MWLPKYRDGFTALTGFDALYHIVLVSMSIAWTVIMLELLWFQQFANYWRGGLVLGGVLLSVGLTCNAVSTYKTLVGQRGLITPLRYCLIYASLLLLLFLIASNSIGITFLVWFLLILAASTVRTLIDFFVEKWIGEAGTYIRQAGWVKRFYQHKVQGIATLNWAGLEIPFGEGSRNAIWFGAISSGKTMSMRLFMQSFVRYIGARPDPNKQDQPPLPTLPVKAAIVYDAKRDFIPLLAGMAPHCERHIISHKDARLSVWDIIRDICSPEDCRTMGELLSPPVVPGPNEFWARACQFIIEGLALYYTLNVPDSWDFRDIIVGASSAERLTAILESDERTKRFLYPLGGERLSHSILTTVQVYLSLFSPIASAWHYKRQHAMKHGLPLKTFCFSDLPNFEGIVVLGRDVDNKVAMAAMNRLFLTKMGRVLLNEPDVPDRAPQYLICLDEAHTLGLLDELEEVATNASSKGVILALAMQSLSSFQRLYGKESANAIISQFYRRSYLRLNDTVTANWAADNIGRGDRFLKSFTNGWSITTNIERRVPIVLAEELRRFPPPAKGKPGLFNKLIGRGGTPLKGFYQGNFGFWNKISPDYLSKNLMPKAKGVKAIEPWSVPLMPTWNWGDIQRLHLEKAISKDDFTDHLKDEDHMKQAAANQLASIKADIERSTKDPRFMGEGTSIEVDSPSEEDEANDDEDEPADVPKSVTTRPPA